MHLATLTPRALSETTSRSPGVRPLARRLASIASAAALFTVILGCGDSTPLVASAPLSGTPTVPSASIVTISTHEVAQTVTVSSTRGDYATASCPQGEVALGGGWSVPSQNVRVFKAVLTGNTWNVFVSFPGPVINPGTAGASAIPQTVPLVMPAPVDVTVTAYVECLAGASSAVVTQRPVVESVPPSATRYDPITAQCNTTEIPVGYSVDMSPSSANLELMATFPETTRGVGDRSNPSASSEDLGLQTTLLQPNPADFWWEFWVKNHDSVADTITVSAECLSGVNASIISPFAQGGSVYQSTTGSVMVDCPSGSVVAGGGLDYQEANNSQNQVGSGNLYLTHATATGWQGAIYGITTDDVNPLVPQVWAVCLSFS